MSDLATITAVRPTANTVFLLVPYGATIAAGQSVYRDSAGLFQLTDADTSVVTASGNGIAITPGVNGGYGLIATGGSIVLVGTTMVVGETYLVSDTAGGIMPNADRDSGDFVTYLGNAASATQLDLVIKATGNQVP